MVFKITNDQKLSKTIQKNPHYVISCKGNPQKNVKASFGHFDGDSTQCTVVWKMVHFLLLKTTIY
jgi:hypothetical protein